MNTANRILLLLAIILSFGEVVKADSPSVPSATDIKLLRKPKGLTSTRPKLPAVNDWLGCTIYGTQLQINYPDNSLPATILLTDADTGFSCYSTTAVNADPIELNLNPGEYTLTVTLVDDRTYSGSLEIE